MQELGLYIIIAALAGIIGFLLFYFRDYIPIFQKGIKKTEVDAEIEGLLDNIRKLAREHQYNKAGLLVWNTFSVAAGGFLGEARQPSQTARAFALTMMAHDEITQETVEPIYELFEKARYSNSEVSLQEFNLGLTGLHRFLKIANNISSRTDSGSQTSEEGTPEQQSTESADYDDF
jgi:hypothetical protein